MAHNEQLADRVREILAASTHAIEEKKMFGGLCFMVNDKMCVGVRANNMMVRIDPAKTEQALEEEGCEPMIHGGKQMPGFVFVDEAALHTKKQLQHWLKMALEYNPLAKPSKKK
ncbi:TfoX/Sxy family transcriptional regulator of competence genes [Chitinophaga niastensis]|uniref:TfoX/Sxy family transcriptional regulator of competence genes n=1 Tax=Chitinophaga niastensis TaxID=536980 RepID=A0A2P8HIJ6_CHINA|nr:TfoX/Sxy family protein [Chitinophaga niastensis]PSL46039.1 TfoX/Sxy family transcriptional regulator of competence genes [Chitinophaga niastensis]